MSDRRANPVGQMSFVGELALAPNRLDTASHVNMLILQSQHFIQATLEAWLGDEVCSQKGPDQLPGKSRSDHIFCIHANDIHIVMLNGIVGKKNIMDQPSSRTGDLVRGDGRSHPATTEHRSAINLSRSDGTGQRDDEIGVVVVRVQAVCPKVHDLIPQAT